VLTSALHWPLGHICTSRQKVAEQRKNLFYMFASNICIKQTQSVRISQKNVKNLVTISVTRRHHDITSSPTAPASLEDVGLTRRPGGLLPAAAARAEGLGGAAEI